MKFRRAEHSLALARYWLQPIAAKGGHDWLEIEWKIQNSHAQLWAAYERGIVAVLLTQITVDDVCEVLLGAGSRAREWLPLAEGQIVPWGRSVGARLTRVWGRRGWSRLLPHWHVAGIEDGGLILELANEK